MDNPQRPLPTPLPNNTRDVNLTCTLTNHLDIDSMLCKDGEHLRRHSDCVFHLFADEREDGHSWEGVDLSSRKQYQIRLII